MFKNKKEELVDTILVAGTAAGVLMLVAGALLFLKERAKIKEFGGRLVKVNYRFSKDFED